MGGTLFLCGAGNSEGVRLAQVINRETARWDRIVLLDDDPLLRGSQKLGVEVTGPLSDLALGSSATDGAVNLVARTTTGRRKVRERILSMPVPIVPLVSSDVDLAGVALADDVIVYRHATLGPEVSLAAGAVVFMGAVVGHECVVGPGCVVASNAVLNARVVLEEGIYVGSNATVLPEMRIGKWATIGAGSLVVGHVAPGDTVVGVPAEVVRRGDHEKDPSTLELIAPALVPPVALDLGAAMTAITEAWRNVLGANDVSADVSFFDAGGSSLGALQVRERIYEKTGHRLATTDMFRFPSIRTMAEHLSRGSEAAPAYAGRRNVARQLASRRHSRDREG